MERARVNDSSGREKGRKRGKNETERESERETRRERATRRETKTRREREHERYRDRERVDISQTGSRSRSTNSNNASVVTKRDNERRENLQLSHIYTENIIKKFYIKYYKRNI